MNIESFKFNPIVEKIVDVMKVKIGNDDPNFFRLQTNFFLALLPSVMNVKIKSNLTGLIPVNLYGINLVRSGAGKGFSTKLLETQVISTFKDLYMYKVFPTKSNLNLDIEAGNRASSLGLTHNEALIELKKEFKQYGTFRFSFDDATVPAIKQMRPKIILAGTGAINLIVDEAGSNFSKLEETLTTFLELYDTGLTREKLTKNTETSTRFQEIQGTTPANLMLFGTPSKLLDGGSTENKFLDIMETGLARRSFINFSDKRDIDYQLTPEQKYDLLSDKTHNQELDNISDRLGLLADINLVGIHLNVSRDVGVELIKYQEWCKERAKEFKEHDDIQRTEMEHRYFKTLKLAGVYAFIEGSFDISMEHLHQAIKFTEEVGKSVELLFRREKPFEKLAKFIAESDRELTHVELNELPYFKGTKAQKEELISLAIAYGYQNNIIIKRQFRDSIEFFKGETLEENDLSKCILSHSFDFGRDYCNADGKQYKYLPFSAIPDLVTKDNLNWVNHYLKDGIRQNSHVIQGFNMIVLDIDGGVSLADVKILLSNYTYVIHTTKRHQSIDPQTGVLHGDRFRVILPTNYTLKLNVDDYKEFMENLADWLPFSGLDEQTFQPNRKWSCYPQAQVFTNTGELLDVTPFIPKTSRNIEYRKNLAKLENMDNLERWFASRMSVGNRNNLLLRFGYMLSDAQLDIVEIQEKLLEFNSKLPNPLPKSEIENTIIKSIQNRN